LKEFKTLYAESILNETIPYSDFVVWESEMLNFYPKIEDLESAADRLNQTHLTQPALFVIEYALAQLWIS
jgi:acyl transferase domain-containing protein